MTRKQDRFASKARTTVRISGQTIRGKHSVSPGMSQLLMLSPDATPADRFRDSLERAKAIAAGTLVPIASKEEIKSSRGVLPAIVRATGIF